MMDETVLQFFRDCDRARQVWTAINLDWVYSIPGHNFQQWWMGLVADRSGDELAYIACVYYCLWDARNRFLFSNMVWSCHSVATHKRMMFDSFQQVLCSVSIDGSASSQSLVTLQNAPSPSFIKLNVETGMVGPDLVGLGVIFQDHCGQVLASACKRIVGHWKPKISEAIDMVFGLNKAIFIIFSN